MIIKKKKKELESLVSLVNMQVKIKMLKYYESQSEVSNVGKQM